MERQRHTEVVNAPLESCFETLVDFARYPDWFALITAADVERADPDAGLWQVRYELDATLKTITYTLAYTAKAPNRLDWRSVAGDLRAIEGSYRLVELEKGLTEATCAQGIDVGLWVPGFLRRTFENSALSQSVREFKAAAEARARAAG